MEHYRDVFDAAISSIMQKALQIVASHPRFALTGARLLYHQKNAARMRRRYEREGLLVPAVMMVSITSRCNLRCTGCYMRAQHREPQPEMNLDQLRLLIAQATELGTSVFVLAGGEPLLRKTDLFDLAGTHAQALFAVFTNGLLLDDTTAQEMARYPNLVPVLSFEGFRDPTDLRRGSGVYDRLRAACFRLQGQRIFFGCSVTVSRLNYEKVCAEDFVTAMQDSGVKAFIFVEYVPVEPGTEDQILTSSQRAGFREFLARCAQEYPAIFIGFPGDDSDFGGCLAAGRGFVHVSSSGDLEPCPAAPFSDTNLTQVPLQEALRSKFLEQIRKDHGRLTESEGGCALWSNRTWAASLLSAAREESLPPEKILYPLPSIPPK